MHIILSDGRPWPDNATTRPTAAEVDAFKSSADQVYAVVIGEGGAPGTANAVDTVLMQSLAKPNDTDHYLRVVDSSQLPDVFRQIAVTILNPRSHLIQVYPAPIISGVGGGGSVEHQREVLHRRVTGHVRRHLGPVHREQRHVDHREPPERSVRPDGDGPRDDGWWRFRTVVPGCRPLHVSLTASPDRRASCRDR